MSRLTTHVLDTAQGLPARDVGVRLERRESDHWIEIGHGRTDADGRCRDLLPDGVSLQKAVYRLTFDSGAYFEGRGVFAFFPSVCVVFEVREEGRPHHVPLLLSPFGYTTYRGS